MYGPHSFSSRGQSVIEIIIGTAIGALLVIAAVSLIAPALKTNTQTIKIQAGASLAKELLDNTRVWTDGDWHNISSLATTSANKYFLVASTSPFVASSGTQTVTVGTTTYSRYFYVSDVSRDGSGYATTSGGTYDPSTKQITVVYGAVGNATDTISAYLTRNRQNTYDQTDWSGGGGVTSSATTTNSQFASSSNIDYGTTTGSIYISL